jgi:hypothetical protein
MFFKDRSVPKGDWYSINGNIAVFEINFVDYDPASDSLIAGMQDNSVQLEVTGPFKSPVRKILETERFGEGEGRRRRSFIGQG